jgi:cytochrome P450
MAGSDTLKSTLEWFTLAMTAHPAVQRRAQDELDAVVGHGRVPRVGDRAHLPYVSALIREVLRWGTPLPIGVPHVSEADAWYEGMFIPKGTMCIVNVRACNMDPEVCC